MLLTIISTAHILESEFLCKGCIALYCGFADMVFRSRIAAFVPLKFNDYIYDDFVKEIIEVKRKKIIFICKLECFLKVKRT